jgi:replication initiation protein RepC
MIVTPIPSGAPGRSHAWTPSGLRRLSVEMHAARDRADAFRGMAAGMAKPFTYLSAFQGAIPYLKLPSKAGDLVAWLVKKTMGHDWEEGSRPIAWPSAREEQEYLQLSAARVKALNRVLYEAGIFVLRDDPQGRRWGRRGPDNRIIEAYGFDLSPLAQRADEFIRLAAARRQEREAAKALRKRKAVARRAIRQAGETLADLGEMPEGWDALAMETARLSGLAADSSSELASIVDRLEACRTQAEAWIKQAAGRCESSPRRLENEPHTGDEQAPGRCESSPQGLENEPHSTDTKLISNLKNTVMAPQGSALPTISHSPSSHPLSQQATSITPAELLELAPRLRAYLQPGIDHTWRTVIPAAAWLAGELKISRAAWEEACRCVGNQGATVMVALVSAKEECHFTKSAAAYFGGMLRKAQGHGSLNLAGSIWALRNRLWGTMQ